ncbi:MAG: response regulator transcription factor [Dehalococcoidia bacterium]
MVRQFRVLIVDDEERILNFLRPKLKVAGYDVLTARNGAEALEYVRLQQLDLVVLDLVMPQMDGLETLKRLRAFSALPVIVLSARDSDIDKIKGLRLGADDYLAKPFNPDELVARIEAVRRRLQPEDKRKTREPIYLGDLKIDFQRRLVFVRGEETYLTRIEWLLLSELAQNVGRFMTYDQLLTRIWGPEYRDDVQLLRTWVSRLRHKVERDPQNPELIRTMPKSGYILERPPAE